MRPLLLSVIFSLTANAADVPFYPRSIETQKDVSGINENFRSVVGDLTKIRADLDANTASIAAISTGTGVAYVAVSQTFTGNNVFSGSNTFSGISTFAGQVVTSSGVVQTPGSFLSAGGPSQNNPIDTGSGIWAVSTDGATQSSGCVVSVLFPDGGGSGDVPTFTSTTTNNSHLNGYRAGVLLESCVPGSKCKVGLGPHQPYRIRADSGGIAAAAGFLFSATRCRAGSQAAFNDNLHGFKMQTGAVSANAFFWAILRE